MTGPAGRLSSICSTMRADSRVSCSRTQYRANESPSAWVQTLKSSSGYDEVRLAVAAQVPVDARRAEVRARDAVGRAELARDDADAAGAGLEDLVADEHVLEVVAAVEDALHRLAAVGDPAPRAGRP